MLPSDHPREAIRTGLEAIAELGGADPEARRRLEATVLTGALIGSERPPSELLDAAAGQCGEGAPSGRMMAAVLAYHRALAGGTADEVAELMELGFGDGWQPDAGLIGAQLTLGLIALGAADERRAELLCADWLATARQRGSLLGVAGAQMISAHLRLARGEVEPAAADAREALELVATAGVDGAASGHAAAALATALIAADRLDAARDVIAPHCHGTGPLAHQGPVAARARLLAAAGDGEAALAEWLRIGELSRRRPVDNPVLLPWRSEAARLLAELGREPERARELAAAELELSRHWGRPRPIGVALGAVALTADGAARITLAEESVETLRAAGAPLELGRALTDLGGILAATDRRAAREPLREALELLGETGAEHLRRRAHRELVAAGGRPRREASAGPASLTPQERRVATLAATGAGNREIAAELVLAVRTIESHLAGAYRKLGVSSRSQLRDALAP
jgi:DNA-binding CsgD family transcriptional regulator